MKDYRLSLTCGALIALLLTACATGPVYSPIGGELPTYAKVATTKKWAFYKTQEFFPDRTALELRSMQTRKFLVSNSKFYDAFKTDCEDTNGKYRPFADSFGCYYKTNFMFSFSDNPKPDYNWLLVKYYPEIKPATGKTGKETVVIRLRIYATTNDYGGDQSQQFTLPIYYQNEFSRLADALFVNAIELTPQEMK